MDFLQVCFCHFWFHFAIFTETLQENYPLGIDWSRNVPSYHGSWYNHQNHPSKQSFLHDFLNDLCWEQSNTPNLLFLCVVWWEQVAVMAVCMDDKPSQHYTCVITAFSLPHDLLPWAATMNFILAPTSTCRVFAIKNLASLNTEHANTLIQYNSTSCRSIRGLNKFLGTGIKYIFIPHQVIC